MALRQTYKNLALAITQPQPNLWRSHAPGAVPARALKLPEADEQMRLTAPSGKPGFCVDEICSCFAHKCEEPPTAPLAFDANTTYNVSFKKHDLPKLVPAAPVALSEHLPFEGKTTYQSQFLPWDVQPSRAPGAAPLPESVPFEGRSTYSDHYGPKALPQQRTVGPGVAPISVEDRDFQTQYGAVHTGAQLDVCPVTKLPPPPKVPNRVHVFWDATSKKWY